MTRLASIKRCFAWLVLTSMLATVAPALAQVIRTGRVPAQSTDTWTLWAPSGSSRIVVDGDGDTDLDCYVYHRNGTLLGFDDDLTDYCIVNVRQATSGTLRIEIRNLGSVWNAYVLSIN